MAIDPYKVWANMKLKIWPERYWMVDLSDGAAEGVSKAVISSASRYCSIIRDQAGLSVTADEKTVTSNIEEQPGSLVLTPEIGKMIER